MTFRILISYHYFKSPDLRQNLAKWFPAMPEIFADSGAYSAMSKGAEIGLKDYAEWLFRNKDMFDVYANLDVIGDGREAADRTWDNQRRLEDHGLRPLPVFHAGEPFDALERLLDHGYGYIGLGGLVGRKAKDTMPWLIKTFEMAQGKAVFHGFGLTTFGVLRALPFYSIDSQSWGSAYKFGRLRLFDSQVGKFIPIHLGHHGTVYDGKGASLIRQYGFDPADFADHSRYSRRLTCQISALSWTEAAVWLRKRHGPTAPPEGTKLPEGLRWAGMRMYLAETDTGNLTSLGLLKEKESVP